MSTELFLSILFAVSLLTGLVVEALKKLLDEAGKTYKPNMLAAIVSLILSTGVYIGYEICTGMTTLTAQDIVFLIALIVASWLSSMLGYDKIVQTLGQLLK